MTSTRSRDLGELLLLPLLAAFGVAWEASGELEETGGEDAAIIAPSWLEEGPLPVLIGGAAALGAAVLLWNRPRSRCLTAAAVQLAGAAVVLGGLAAGGLRVASARSDGANIGAGLVVLLGPLLLIAFGTYVWQKWQELP